MGLRIDHLLLSPQAADRLTAADIDRDPRGKDKASDHTPVWCTLQEARMIHARGGSAVQSHRTEGEPKQVNYCHCRMCQRSAGAPSWPGPPSRPRTCSSSRAGRNG